MTEILTLHLTGEQEAQFAPLVRCAAESRKNVLFLATAVPRDRIWHLQIVHVPARIGSKITRLLKGEGGAS